MKLHITEEAGILVYDLSTPEGRAAHSRALKALDLCGVLWDFSQDVLRRAYKRDSIAAINEHEEIQELTEEQSKAVEMVSQHFYKLMQEHGIDLSELYS